MCCMNSRIATSPARISHTTGDIPNTDGAPSAGRSQPHSEERSTPKTTSPMPTAQSSEPSRSMRAILDRCVGDPAGEQDDAGPDEHLAGEHPPPGRVCGGQTADQRSEGDRDRAGRSDQAVGARPTLGGKFPATSATIAGMISAAPIPSRSDHPMSSTVRLGDRAVVSEPVQ